ncbi:hypothetical protein H696_02049 [Fonticula alba]|uniref:Uncharacterized protein n=1 Tax=Fonticula alba TaxID=691883 RepID=A0A058ZCE0_FONAL|nr:hypothetical protein H696_02049 [Fonticula alba]KCV71102.1 hypothetical protein H696_02049 [Fonticula alba]|eukprot:XP_009494225.1 hypothetical protein H696_02049 [Fonticula alba]
MLGALHRHGRQLAMPARSQPPLARALARLPLYDPAAVGQEGEDRAEALHREISSGRAQRLIPRFRVCTLNRSTVLDDARSPFFQDPAGLIRKYGPRTLRGVFDRRQARNTASFKTHYRLVAPGPSDSTAPGGASEHPALPPLPAVSGALEAMSTRLHRRRTNRYLSMAPAVARAELTAEQDAYLRALADRQPGKPVDMPTPSPGTLPSKKFLKNPPQHYYAKALTPERTRYFIERRSYFAWKWADRVTSPAVRLNPLAEILSKQLHTTVEVPENILSQVEDKLVRRLLEDFHTVLLSRGSCIRLDTRMPAHPPDEDTVVLQMMEDDERPVLQLDGDFRARGELDDQRLSSPENLENTMLVLALRNPYHLAAQAATGADGQVADPPAGADHPSPSAHQTTRSNARSILQMRGLHQDDLPFSIGTACLAYGELAGPAGEPPVPARHRALHYLAVLDQKYAQKHGVGRGVATSGRPAPAGGPPCSREDGTTTAPPGAVRPEDRPVRPLGPTDREKYIPLESLPAGFSRDFDVALSLTDSYDWWDGAERFDHRPDWRLSEEDRAARPEGCDSVFGPRRYHVAPLVTLGADLARVLLASAEARDWLQLCPGREPAPVRARVQALRAAGDTAAADHLQALAAAGRGHLLLEHDLTTKPGQAAVLAGARAAVRALEPPPDNRPNSGLMSLRQVAARGRRAVEADSEMAAALAAGPPVLLLAIQRSAARQASTLLADLYALNSFDVATDIKLHQAALQAQLTSKSKP